MKRRTIMIDGMPFSFDDENDDMNYDVIKPISIDNAKKLLAKTKELFDKCGIRFYLVYGTLLGAIRDNSIIKGDEDVDVFVESEIELRKNIPFLNDNGLKVVRVCEKAVYSFRINDECFIDVYIKTKLPLSIWSLWCDSLAGKAVPKCYIKKFDTINFLGVDCLVPHKPERLLAFWYGESWRVPIRGHHFTYELSSRYWWKTKGKYKLEAYLSYCRIITKDPKYVFKKVCRKLFQFQNF